MANAYFAQIETALTASHRGRLERLAESGEAGAAEALALLEHADRPIAMAQAGVTCMSLFTGLGIGLFALPIFSGMLTRLLPGMEIYAAALVLSILVMTTLTLLFGDFLPKQIALQNPEEMLLRKHRTIALLTQLTALPSAALISISRGILLIFGINPENRVSATEDAVKDLMEQGTEDGTFEKTEQDMVDRIFHMSDQTASALMTPRTQIAWVDLAEPRAEQLRIVRAEAHDVFPVAYENLDDFRGVVYAKELLDAALDGTEIDITDYIRKPLFVPRTMEGLRVLEKFRSGAIHEAVVLDEYGGVVGFITMDDIMGEIIGSADEDAPTGTRTGAEKAQTWSSASTRCPTRITITFTPSAASSPPRSAASPPSAKPAHGRTTPSRCCRWIARASPKSAWRGQMLWKTATDRMLRPSPPPSKRGRWHAPA